MVTQSTISNNLWTFKSKRLSTKFTGTTENYALRGFLAVKMFIQSDFRSVFEAEGFCDPIASQVSADILATPLPTDKVSSALYCDIFMNLLKSILTLSQPRM